MPEPGTVLITGSTDGLGLACATDLAAEGRHGTPPRPQSGASSARRAMPWAAPAKPSSPPTSPTSHRSTPSVSSPTEILSERDRLDVLVNNAGVVSRERQLSRDGYELTFAVNYLSHFLLTTLLLPLLERSAPARIVNVASVGQRPVDFDDVMLERSYDPIRAYCQSKLAQIMFTFGLAEKLGDIGRHRQRASSGDADGHQDGARQLRYRHVDRR